MRNILIPLFLILSSFSQAQNDIFIIRFSDKNNSPFSVSNPQQFLSERSINRKAAKNIPITVQDLPVNPDYVSQVAATGATIKGKSRWLNALAVQVSSTAQLNAINQLPFVVSNNPLNRVAENQTDKFKNEFLSPYIAEENYNASRSASDFDYGPGYGQINMVGGTWLHSSGYRGQGMLIAVFDAGFPGVNTIAAFDSLRNENRILATYDMVLKNNFVYGYNQHGTNTLSCMAANVPGSLIGTAPKAEYLLIRTEDAATETKTEEFYWVEGAEFADSCGADIISSSLGYTAFDNASLSYTIDDLDGNTAICTIGADIAAEKGILVVNSAGNYGGSAWQRIGTPADGNNVFAIGGVNSNLQRANFSSIGPSADGRIKPDVSAQAVSTIVFFSDNVLGGANGTSFSCPIISGMSACLWQANTDASNFQLMNAIKLSASQAQNPDNLLGWGIPNFSDAMLLINKTDKNSFPALENFQLYPNPSENNFNISFYSADSQTIRIYITDMFGRIVIDEQHFVTSKSYNKFEYNTNNSIAGGLYLVNLKSAEKNHIQKLIIKK